ncbi:hypothetical protein HU200_032026 [Digitaria exilis]|uniref:Uncharacterized protein n=1 Tax=Digitaria exilis TaxID=1010633 RepID=A0A835BTL2_9POAL|nr:hypothetical protein HU200_032026 [Digitaria exilis]
MQENPPRKISASQGCSSYYKNPFIVAAKRQHHQRGSTRPLPLRLPANSHGGEPRLHLHLRPSHPPPPPRPGRLRSFCAALLRHRGAGLREGHLGRGPHGPRPLLRGVAPGRAGQRRRGRARARRDRHQPHAGQLHGRRGGHQGPREARRRVAGAPAAGACHVSPALHRGAQRRAQRRPRAGVGEAPRLRGGDAGRREGGHRLRGRVRRRQRRRAVAAAEGGRGRRQPHHHRRAHRQVAETRTGRRRRCCLLIRWGDVKVIVDPEKHCRSC